MSNFLTPVQIVAELNKYIIGQEAAKRSVAIALRNRWRRQHAPAELRNEIVPNNILLIGSTGVGKTEIARRLAKLADAPFVKVEASKFTEVGYVGRDVESMVRDLVEQAVGLVRAQQLERNRQKAMDAAEEALLDILIPPVAGHEGQAAAGSGIGFDPSRASDAELNQRTREKFRERLKAGELDERQVDIEVPLPTPQVHMVGNQAEGLDGLQDMLSHMLPKRSKRRKMPVREARVVLAEQEAEKLLDHEAMVREALERAQYSGIIFIDEIDKVASPGGANRGPDVSREGVQRDLLPVVEGCTVNTKYGPVSTDHVLFIAAGAFHLAKPSDLIPELQGRFPIRVELSALTQADFVSILRQPRNALTKQYQALFAAEGVELAFDDDALDALAEMAWRLNQDMENIGARRLHTVMSNLLEDWLFQLPDLLRETQLRVTAAMVHERLAPIVQQRDLSAYIL